MRTSGVKKLVEQAIGAVRKPYTEDVIDDVFLAIERNDSWVKEYEDLCLDLTKTVVNNWVGVWVSKHVGRVGGEQTSSARTKLAGSYSKLTVVGTKLGGRRKEAEALQLMSDYYRAHKSQLPANIAELRPTIVELLMEGVEPAEAFSLASTK